jgi:hypothetical protein
MWPEPFRLYSFVKNVVTFDLLCYIEVVAKDELVDGLHDCLKLNVAGKISERHPINRYTSPI